MNKAPGFNRRAILLGAATFPLAGCVAPRSPSRQTIRVATFNIWHDAQDWTARLPLIVDALREADADVIALQEVLEDAAKGLPNQASTIAGLLGGYAVRFASTSPTGAPRRYGNAILSRLPVLNVASKNLEPLEDYRTALRVRVSLGPRPIDIVCTHLAWQPDASAVRERQVADLIEWLPLDAAPLIVMGDFNAPLTDPGLVSMGPPRFTSAVPLGAVPSTLNPAQGHAERVIDHIFAERRWFTPIAARRFGDRARDGVYPSDHFGVSAALELAPA